MKIILSPSKTMQFTKSIEHMTKPNYYAKAKFLVDYLLSLDKETLFKAWKANESICSESYQYLQDFAEEKIQGPAIFSYTGLVFKKLNANSLSNDALSYLDKNLIILSALFGPLRSFDAICPYRLDFNCKIKIKEFKDLYKFWADDLSCFFNEKLKNELIINLASKEYSKAVLDVIDDKNRVIDIVFYDDKSLKEKATLSKIGRGLMLSYLSSQNVIHIDVIKNFQDGFLFDEKLSSSNKLCFVKGN